mmetsp:Transcript_19024/g.47424  ORF Transcript_19024/g.47424 Transcript_19024/m.47424 type:complete len:202 (-) Transcript_19024:943-1548(-)
MARSSPEEPVPMMVPKVRSEISSRTLTYSPASSSACSVLSSATQSCSSLVEPTSWTEPSARCSVMGWWLGSGSHESVTSTSTTACGCACDSCSPSPSVRLLPSCHCAEACRLWLPSLPLPSSMMTYLYSCVSWGVMGMVVVHTCPAVHSSGNAAFRSQSFQVPTMATRCPGVVSTLMSNFTGMATGAPHSSAPPEGYSAPP